MALDVPTRQEALDLVERLEGTCRWFKVGMELYYAEGRQIVEELVRRGFRVFLDLKMYDIPATVAGAVRSIADTGASLLTVHASGGRAMMEAAGMAADRPGGPTLLAVTVLTSLDVTDLRDLGIAQAPSEHVLRLAQLAVSAGISNLVCSADEVVTLRQHLHPDSMLVVPGIRPVGSDMADQRRVATPESAIAQGASMLVVGRPITRARRPVEAATAVLSAMTAALTALDHRDAP